MNLSYLTQSYKVILTIQTLIFHCEIKLGHIKTKEQIQIFQLKVFFHNFKHIIVLKNLLFCRMPVRLPKCFRKCWNLIKYTFVIYCSGSG